MCWPWACMPELALQPTRNLHGSARQYLYFRWLQRLCVTDCTHQGGWPHDSYVTLELHQQQAGTQGPGTADGTCIRHSWSGSRHTVLRPYIMSMQNLLLPNSLSSNVIKTIHIVCSPMVSLGPYLGPYRLLKSCPLPPNHSMPVAQDTVVAVGLLAATGVTWIRNPRKSRGTLPNSLS
jgi:hypothetical protein